MMIFQSFVTPRLILRRLATGDVATMFAYRSDPEVARFQSWEPASVGEIRGFIDRLDEMDLITPGEWFQLGIALRDTGELVGDCGLHPRSDDPRLVEVGITIAPAFQRRGFAYEALTAVLDHVFTHTETHRVHGSVDPRNRPCIALLRKVGLHQEAHLIKSLWLKGEWVDDLIFAVRREEWRKRDHSNRR